MRLEPPFDRLRPPAATGLSETVTIDLPADLTAWLESRCGGDPTLRSEYVTLALDALKQYEQRGGWPDLPPRPGPRTPEEIAALRAEIAAIQVPQEEKDAFNDWLRERDQKREALTTAAEAVDRTEAEANRRAA